jgi:hypothetical protein
MLLMEWDLVGDVLGNKSGWQRSFLFFFMFFSNVSFQQYPTDQGLVAYCVYTRFDFVVGFCRYGARS